MFMMFSKKSQIAPPTPEEVLHLKRDIDRFTSKIVTIDLGDRERDALRHQRLRMENEVIALQLDIVEYFRNSK